MVVISIMVYVNTWITYDSIDLIIIYKLMHNFFGGLLLHDYDELYFVCGITLFCIK